MAEGHQWFQIAEPQPFIWTAEERGSTSIRCLRYLLGTGRGERQSIPLRAARFGPEGVPSAQARRYPHPASRSETGPGSGPGQALSRERDRSDARHQPGILVGASDRGGCLRGFARWPAALSEGQRAPGPSSDCTRSTAFWTCAIPSSPCLACISSGQDQVSRATRAGAPGLAGPVTPTCGTAPWRERVMGEILKYNEEDMAATGGVLRWLRGKR